jgi:hypothetical protein
VKSTLRVSRQFLVPEYSRIAAGWHELHTAHSIRMCHKQCKFFRNRSVMTGTLLESSKQFLVPTSPRIAAGWT